MADPKKYINKVIINGEVKVDLTTDTVEPSNILTGFKAHDKTGAPIVGTCTFNADTSDATASASEILVNKTAYVAGSKVTGSMPNNGGIRGSISTVAGEYTVPRGYHDGSGKVSIATEEQAKLIATNIRQGVTVLGVEGTMSGTEGANAQAKTVTPTFLQQSITPDSADGYNYLSEVTVKPIPVTETLGANGGYTLSVG